MHLKWRLARIGVCLLAAGAVGYVVFLDSGQATATRTARLNKTAGELRQGNYFAWGQLVLWLEKLDPSEKKFLKDACADYATSNQMLHVIGSAWPPEATLRRTQNVGDWMKYVLCIDDISLEYDQVLCPVKHDIAVTNFQAMFETSVRPAMATVLPGASSPVKPSANPGQ